MNTINLMKAALCTCLLAICAACNEEKVTDCLMTTTKLESQFENCRIVYPLSQEYKNAMTRNTGSDFGTDWENYENFTFSNGTSISLPWSETSSGAVPFDLAMDIKKEDGWIMLLHTLTGYTSDIQKFIVLYNQRTGIMKVFYYAPGNIPNNTAKWNIHFVQDQKWLNHEAEIAIPINMGSFETFVSTNAVLGQAKGFVQGWNCFQMTLAYDPNPNSVQTINILGSSDNVTQYNFFGDSYAYSNGTILTYASMGSNPDININVGSIFGGDAENYIINNINQATTRFLDLNVIKKAIKVVGKLTGWLKGDSEPSVIKSDLKITTRGNFSATGFSNSITNNTALNTLFTEEKVGKLGSWNLCEQPTVYLNPFADYDSKIPVTGIGERTYRLRGITRYAYDLVINPNLQSHIKKQWVEFDLVRYIGPSDFIPEVPEVYTDFGNIGGVGGGFTIMLDSDDYILGKYGSDKAIVNYDIQDLTVLLQGRYHMTIGYDADEIFVPNAAIYGKTKVNIQNVFLRMSLYTVTEFEGKEATTVSSRTFIPKFEWDPEIYNQYKDMYPKWGVNVSNLSNNADKGIDVPVNGIYYTDEKHPQGILIEAY